MKKSKLTIYRIVCLRYNLRCTVGIIKRKIIMLSTLVFVCLTKIIFNSIVASNKTNYQIDSVLKSVLFVSKQNKSKRMHFDILSWFHVDSFYNIILAVLYIESQTVYFHEALFLTYDVCVVLYYTLFLQ